MSNILYLLKDKYDSSYVGVRTEIEKNLDAERMMLAFLDGCPAGFLWSRLVEDIDEVIMMIVARNMYGKGVGGALLEEERKYAAAKGARLMRISEIENP